MALTSWQLFRLKEAEMKPGLVLNVACYKKKLWRSDKHLLNVRGETMFLIMKVDRSMHLFSLIWQAYAKFHFKFHLNTGRAVCTRQEGSPTEFRRPHRSPK